ncbi:LysR family transcriptional regulator [Paraburkholderia aromaticivorans]|uniref:LysR family transcriptional regulator n=1 Tax=Paraburkholderia aromaticivorans TaxID=2026199 RepID=UPI001455E59E|nr:LysR family transcriptional regulator [Paraburkholderia aromaticivorans]
MSGLSIQGLIRRVDLFTLKLFLSVVEERQIGRAAIRENIAASAATKRIQDLEDVAGIRLFDRNPKGVVTSQAGEVLARHVRVMFASLDEIRRDIGELIDGVSGHVGIGATGSIIIQYLAREIAEFTRDFPMVQVELHEDVNAKVMRAVASGDIDVGVFVATANLANEAIDSVEYRTDDLVAVVPLGHPLSERASVTLVDLMQEDIIGIAPNTTLMTELHKAAALAGRELHPKYNVNSVEAARSLVQEGLGVTIQPECMLSLEDYERLSTVALAEPWAHRSIHIGTQRGKALSSATTALIKQLTERPQPLGSDESHLTTDARTQQDNLSRSV